MLERVFFQKPDLGALHDAGLQAVDMHFHTQYSDSHTQISSLIKLAKKRKVGVAITDHNIVTGSLKAMESDDIFVIPGIEVNCREGRDLQIYFYNKSELIHFYDKCIRDFLYENPYGRTKKTIVEVLDDIEPYNCIASMSQPYGILWKGWMSFLRRTKNANSIVKKVSAIEVINGEDTRMRNLKSVVFAMEKKKPITAGSDGHTLGELGRVIAYADAHNVDDFLDAIRKKKNYVMGTEGTRLRGIFNQSRVLSKRIKYMPSIARTTYEFSVKNRIDELKPRIKKTFRNTMDGIRNGFNNRRK